MDSLNPLNFQAHAGRVAQAYGARGPIRVGAPQVPNAVAKATVGPDGAIQPPFPATRDPNGRGAAPDTRQDRVTITGRGAGARPSQTPTPQAQIVKPPVALNARAPATPAIEQLVAGQVDSPVARGEGFDEPGFSRQAARPAVAGPVGRPVTANGAYPMYTRSADRIEAATSVAVGRSLDTRG